MVKKLMKYELIYYSRILTMFLPWLPVMGMLTCILYKLYDDSTTMTLALVSSTLLLSLANMALLLFAMVLGIVRFYKNMYSAEGYLTFTLPVTSLQHVTAKLVVYLGVMAVCGLVSLLSVTIASHGEYIADLGIALAELKVMFDNLNIPVIHIVFYCIELLLILLVSYVSVPLLFYACISLGQRAKKNRVLMSIGVYFIYNIGLQILGTVFAIYMALFAQTDIFDSFMALFADGYSLVHFIFLCILPVQIAMAALFLFVTVNTMNKKLNLE